MKRKYGQDGDSGVHIIYKYQEMLKLPPIQSMLKCRLFGLLFLCFAYPDLHYAVSIDGMTG